MLRGGDRPGEHDHRVDTDRRRVEDAGARLQAQLVGLLARHQQHGARRRLRSARRLPAVMRAVLLERRLQRARASRGSCRSGCPGRSRTVSPSTLDRHDLAVEATLLGRPRGEPRASAGRTRRARSAGSPSARRSAPRRGPAGSARSAPSAPAGTACRALRVRRVRAHRHAPHVLDAGADHDVVHARGDHARRRSSPPAGPSRTAESTVLAGVRHRQARLQPRVARDVLRLLADLRHAARRPRPRRAPASMPARSITAR